MIFPRYAAINDLNTNHVSPTKKPTPYHATDFRMYSAVVSWTTFRETYISSMSLAKEGSVRVCVHLHGT